MLASSYTHNLIECGLDEAGRGCLCGPVVAAGVVLPKNFTHKILRDSKQLSAKERNELAEEIKEKAIEWTISEANATEIDTFNILNASILAMHRCVEKLQTKPELLLIDGNRFHPYNFIPYQCVVKGDDKFFSIAAASVLAKTHRDKIMKDLAEQFPMYSWEKNMGYPTQTHRQAIKDFGITIWHRKTFKGVKELVSNG
ncbi:MAG: ribonuclease HII [Cytophagia bacterium]|nr:MAG: ribonuclease HII [Cytophagales bacterium]TAG01503.1 MAG: ribonuclease HII [Cytophagia bacterium]TAG38666.1 MAG: ribonuclease HII [Cytophagia bacterium]TAH27932.1 MAG: ribonuclease HII [Cytophagales bacterium]